MKLKSTVLTVCLSTLILASCAKKDNGIAPGEPSDIVKGYFGYKKESTEKITPASLNNTKGAKLII
jgi:hypothetical protein